MPGDEENMTDEAVWETLPHLWISISMVFFIAATVFTLLKICGDVAALGWWDLFINYSIAQCFAFLGTPSGAKDIPIWVIFSPLLLLQGAGVLFAAYRLIEKIVLLLHHWDLPRSYSSIASKSRDCFGFFHHGSRLLGWWSIDEGSREEESRLFCAGSSGYNTFSPDTVKKMPRGELVEEIWRLQDALREQTEVTKYGQEEYEKLQNEKILCRVCFEEQINVVLLPCKHHILCSTCCEKCKKCPICRGTIEERMPVYDV
ncbi:hypothetical protein TSUD_39940 [Trifolium subterraneum]|uniref:RING-type domain-containing protein n=1 Tax=Trifolium subterraneum TaxID=3900 RepID=A0A2Z6MJW9_TRISU|nr:hypothetical protein TSUD_39940 [Trifolium subterraneum]